MECLNRLFAGGDSGGAETTYKPRVLLVDDDEICNMANEVALKRVNYETVSARDGGTALTRVARPERAVTELGVEHEEAFFVQLFKAPEVLVVGSGGGREILRDLRAGAAHVTGVEINPAINHIVEVTMADYAGRLFQDA